MQVLSSVRCALQGAAQTRTPESLLWAPYWQHKAPRHLCGSLCVLFPDQYSQGQSFRDTFQSPSPNPQILCPLLAQLSRSQVLSHPPSSHSSQQGGQCPLSLGLPLLPTLHLCTLTTHVLAQPVTPVGQEGSFPIQLQRGRECHTLPQGFPSWQAGEGRAV